MLTDEEIMALKEELELLKKSFEELNSELTSERQKALEIKKHSSLELELTKAGALDTEYLIYKTNSDALFDEDGHLTEPSEYIKNVKDNFPHFFKEKELSGVLPGEAVQRGGLSDTGILTYSEEKRLFDRRI